ncbi:DUF4296 domain-containing protein [uncultured Winogradskyella sp.]|uniref:DUF4296 domain-containing protein n=1 Tax=uncultured Winogradskyella sp. TaxID=395353 RepID=UPI00260647D7|nr:DUF4296 domain-containing protein [uncultured Winogradskyella sp.]
MRNLGIIFLLALLVIACNTTEKPKKPDNLIPKDKMEKILYDLYIINAAKGVNKRLLETNGFEPESYVLKKYNIDSLQFANSNTFYAYDTNSYRRIVENVKTRLEKEKEVLAELEKVEGKAAKRKRDSLNKIKQKAKDSIKKTLKQKDTTNQKLEKGPMFDKTSF